MTDFLLGAIILCFYVNLDRRGSVSWTSKSMFTTEEMLVLLKEARSICFDRSFSSTDAKKVGLAIQLTLESTGEIADNSAQLSEGLEDGNRQNSTLTGLIPEFSTWLDACTDLYHFSESQLTFSELDPFNFMSDESTNADLLWNSNAFAQD